MNLKKKKTAEPINNEADATEEMEQLETATINGIKEADKAAIEVIDEEFLAEIKLEEEELKKQIPEFNLEEEIEKNPMFAVMLSFREPMERVFEYFNPDYQYQRIEQEILEKIKLRKLRPNHIEQRGKNASYDISRLSSKDIEEIDKRVRRGERIEL